MTTAKEMAKLIANGENIVFLTGAGVSTPSGIPDYRSMDGIYTTSGLKEPEYLLSRQAMLHDTEDFYRFIKQLYRTGARPNAIHEKMSQLGTVITQNIDGLHGEDAIEFHGTLKTCRCESCQTALDFEAFLKDCRHENCGGTIRPDVVLYDEEINYDDIVKAQRVLQAADTVVIVGTSFKVHPFASLIYAANEDARIYAINKDPIDFPGLWESYEGDAMDVFELL